ncbi:hypothetical protein LY622_11225 [Halomonas sp. M5N1S17]|uniref:hypothetical protein n=1 Tax=Halomonas alkalisoli TaxID=2907158 RepID=UPI001F1A9458|nr:hypothetical protein [Halomonas alkalisoli]MCE9664017.1 hypothetical protein [Halomonas alkalisoli]
MYFDGFLCASLSSEIERRLMFSSSFKDPAQYRFVESVDGRDWTVEDADKHVSEEFKLLRKKERDRGKSWVNEAAVACAITHRDKLLKEAAERECFLCEDDIVLDGSFISYWQCEMIRSRLSELNGLVLGCYSSHNIIAVREKPLLTFGKFGVYEVLGCKVYSGACYFLPPPLAESVIFLQAPVKYTADQWDAISKSIGFPIFLIHPAPASFVAFSSNIGYGNFSVSSNSLFWRSIRKINRKVNSNHFMNKVTFKSDG